MASDPATPTTVTRVIAVLADFVSGQDIYTADALVNDLGMDSLELVAARTALEGEFGIEIPDEVMAELETVGELAEYVAAKLTAKDSAADKAAVPSG